MGPVEEDVEEEPLGSQKLSVKPTFCHVGNNEGDYCTTANLGPARGGKDKSGSRDGKGSRDLCRTNIYRCHDD